MRTIRRLCAVTVVWAAAMLAAPGTAHAQLKGTYIPGFSGLGNGSQPPPSITVFLPVFFYTTDTINDADGNAFGAHPRVNTSFIGPGLAWVTNVKVLGANLGGSAAPVAFFKSRIEGPSLDVPSTFGFTDIYVSPVQLGWNKRRADFKASYGVFIPTGKWEQGGSDNTGLGQWSHLFQAGTTLRLDDKRAWSTSLLASYEIHSHKKDSDLRTGDVLTLEGGTGKAFYRKVEGTPLPQVTSFGLVYYGQFKVTSDEGPLLDPRVNISKDQVFGIGLEGSIFLPKPKLLIGLRAIPELGARSRTTGWAFMLTLAYQAKSLVKMPPTP